MLTLQLEPVAILESCYKEKFGTPRQGVLSPQSHGLLKMQKPYTDFSFIQDLNLHSHLWLIGVFHLNKETPKSKVRVPRLLGSKISVFATRSPHRPNPLSLSLVKIRHIEPGGIYISGLDLVDGTPIYDIKPYLPEYDICLDAKSKLETCNPNLKVEFSAEARSVLQQVSRRQPTSKLEALITDSLQYDPRPLAYLEKYSDRVYGVHIYDYNVRFQIDEKSIIVKNIIPLFDTKK